VINYLDFKNLNVENLLKDLRKCPWDNAFIFNDVDDILETLELLLNQIVKDHIPLKQKKVKCFKQLAWINEIVVAFRKHDQDLKRARK
jgi:hypothetical protein